MVRYRGIINIGHINEVTPHWALLVHGVTVTDCRLTFNTVTDLFVKCHLKLHIDITLHFMEG